MCAGYQFFGLQYSSQCFCGNEYDSSATLGDAAESDCNMPCNGDPTVMCGGSWRNSVYHITGEVDLDVLQADVTYSYRGCYVDQSTRALNGDQFNMGDQATTRVCAELCVGYTSSAPMQNGATWVKNSKLRFCNHLVGLVETFPTMYNSAMRAPLAKPPQAPQVPSTGQSGWRYRYDLNLMFRRLSS